MDTPPDQSPLNHALSCLPHGSEFRFVDSLKTLDPGKSGAAQYTVRGDECFLGAHFPGRPMLPGVILIEAIAQLGGVVSQCAPGQPQLDDLRLTAVRNAKILGAAVPGDDLHIEVTVEGRMAGLVQVSGEIRSTRAAGETRIIATARVTLSGELRPEAD